MYLSQKGHNIPLLVYFAFFRGRNIHYDEIGLLKPSELTQSGYRLYNDEALQKLQQILFFKELGFKLKDIQELLEKPDFDRYCPKRKNHPLCGWIIILCPFRVYLQSTD